MSRSASTPRIGTQTLTVSAAWVTPSRHPHPPGGTIGARLLTFRATAADQAHVASMPDTEWPVNGTPATLIPEQPQTSGSDVTYLLTTLQQRITCVRLPDPHLTAHPPPFPHRSPRRSSTNAACGGLIPSPAGRHRRANNPSSLAQHRIKKLDLHRTPLCVRDTRGLRPPPARAVAEGPPPSPVQHRIEAPVFYTGTSFSVLGTQSSAKRTVITSPCAYRLLHHGTQRSKTWCR